MGGGVWGVRDLLSVQGGRSIIFAWLHYGFTLMAGQKKKKAIIASFEDKLSTVKRVCSVFLS